MASELSADRIAYIRKVLTAVPFIDGAVGAGVKETQDALRDLIDAHEAMKADAALGRQVREAAAALGVEAERVPELQGWCPGCGTPTGGRHLITCEVRNAELAAKREAAARKPADAAREEGE